MTAKGNKEKDRKAREMREESDIRTNPSHIICNQQIWSKKQNSQDNYSIDDI